MALVSYIIGDCPGCGSVGTYGNVDVRDSYISRGCLRCSYKERIPLPPVKKAILYLDQNFYSHSFRGTDPRFKELQQMIQEAASQQLLVAPYSSIHEDETHQWGERKEELMEFIKAASRGYDFAPSYEVELNQLCRAIKAWIAGDTAEYAVDEKDALHDDLHVWDGYFRIDVGRYIGDIGLIRELKKQSVVDLVGLFEDWAVSETTLEQDLAIEHRDAAKGYLQSFEAYTRRLMVGDYNAILDAPIMSKVVETLLHYIPDDVPSDKRVSEVGKFLVSEHFHNAPYQDISSRTFAALKAMVRGGAYTNRSAAKTRLKGFFYDVTHIAIYSPYCDAIFIDKAMSQLMARPEVALSKRYGVKVFSVDSLDEFKVWLRELAENMSAEHRDALSRAYPS